MNRICKSSRIAEQLRGEFIRSGELPGTLVASAHQISKRFGVSFMTANKAINSLADSKMLYRVKGSGTFLCKFPESVLHVGFLDYDTNPNFCEEMNKVCMTYIKTVNGYFFRHQCRLTRFDVENMHVDFSDDCKTCNIDGFIMNIDFRDSITVENLLKTGKPVVVYRLASIADLPFSQVCYNLVDGVDDVFQKLRPSSSDVPVMIYENNPNGIAIFNMFRRKAVRYGFPENDIESVPIKFRNRMLECRKLVRANNNRWRGRLLFSLADAVTLELLNAFADEGMYFPRDFRIVSLGNAEAYGIKLYDMPRITSMDMPMADMAEEACSLLMRQINEPSKSQYIVRIPTSCIVRESTG